MKSSHTIDKANILDSKHCELLLPTKIRKKGRPKGREFSVIGPPYKKKVSPMKENILPFKKYPFKDVSIRY